MLWQYARHSRPKSIRMGLFSRFFTCGQLSLASFSFSAVCYFSHTLHHTGIRPPWLKWGKPTRHKEKNILELKKPANAGSTRRSWKGAHLSYYFNLSLFNLNEDIPWYDHILFVYLKIRTVKLSMRKLELNPQSHWHGLDHFQNMDIL